MGIALLLVSQAMLNMMVAVGLFPVTGQPLPLISKGGTSTLINCAYIGMILSVSRYVAEKEALREQKEQESNNEKLQAAAQALILQAQEMASTDINANQSIPSESEDNAEAHNDIEQKSSDV
jgi:cell division protein FtsW